jgi:hypothetical protein
VVETGHQPVPAKNNLSDQESGVTLADAEIQHIGQIHSHPSNSITKADFLACEGNSMTFSRCNGRAHFNGLRKCFVI